MYVHRQDWGAILLIDERFNKSPKYTNGMNTFTVKERSVSLGAGTKVGPDQLGSLTSDRAKNGFVTKNYSTFAPISPRLD